MENARAACILSARLGLVSAASQLRSPVRWFFWYFLPSKSTDKVNDYYQIEGISSVCVTLT